MNGVNAGGRLDRLPIARFHYRTVGLVAGGMFLDGFEIHMQGVLLAAVLATNWSTPEQNAVFVSATFAGTVLGAWLAGFMGDRYGRRASYQTNLLIFGLASFAAAAAPDMTWLSVARFVMGIGLGAEIVVGYATVAELVPPASRGRWGLSLAAFTNLGLFASALAGRAIVPEFGWRPLFVGVGVAALVVWVARKRMPESPRWLESKGRLAEAEAVLRAIEDDVEAASGRALPPATEPPPAIPVRAATLSDLFARAMILRTLAGSVLLVAVNVSLYGLVTFLPSFMIQRGLSIVTTLNYTTLIALGGPCGALLGIPLADRFGRKVVIVGAACGAAGFGYVYTLSVEPAEIVAAGLAMVTCTFLLATTAFAVFVPELFPTAIRMRGAGLCHTLGRLASVAAPPVTTLLYARWRMEGVVGFVATVLALAVTTVCALGFETKGQSLENLGQAMPAVVDIDDGLGPEAAR